MADKLTLDKFITCFAGSDENYSPPELDDLRVLGEISLTDDVFIKKIHDDQYIQVICEKVTRIFGKDNLNFFTWLEFKGSSFWLFPVVIYQNNNNSDLVENSIRLIEFRQKVCHFYNRKCTEPVKATIKIRIVGYTSKNLEEMNQKSGELYFYRRQAEIVRDNLIQRFGKSIE